MGKDTMYAARMQFTVATGTGTMVPVVGLDGSFRTQKTKPRRVLDVRYMVLATEDDLMAAQDRYYMRWGSRPDVMRVHPATEGDLKLKAEKLAKKWAPQALPGYIDATDKGLTFCGVKVTL